MDLHRIYEGFNPLPDGESPVRHRTGIVDVVNADGTADIDFGGTVVPNVSVLRGAFVEAGDVVQVAAWAGDLLVLGAVAAADGAGPLGTLGYAQVTASQTGITTEVDLTGLAVVATVAAGRRIKVTVHGLVIVLGLDDRGIGGIEQDGTDVGRWYDYTALTSGGSDSRRVGEAAAILTPSAGAHTYTATLARAAGTASTITLEAAATAPAWILVEDIGAA